MREKINYDNIDYLERHFRSVYWDLQENFGKSNIREVDSLYNEFQKAFLPDCYSEIVDERDFKFIFKSKKKVIKYVKKLEEIFGDDDFVNKYKKRIHEKLNVLTYCIRQDEKKATQLKNIKVKFISKYESFKKCYRVYEILNEDLLSYVTKSHMLSYDTIFKRAKKGNGKIVFKVDKTKGYIHKIAYVDILISNYKGNYYISELKKCIYKKKEEEEYLKEKRIQNEIFKMKTENNEKDLKYVTTIENVNFLCRNINTITDFGTRLIVYTPDKFFIPGECVNLRSEYHKDINKLDIFELWNCEVTRGVTTYHFEEFVFEYITHNFEEYEKTMKLLEEAVDIEIREFKGYNFIYDIITETAGEDLIENKKFIWENTNVSEDLFNVICEFAGKKEELYYNAPIITRDTAFEWR